MSKALSFVRLDLLTIRPYLSLKNLILLLAVAVFVSLSTGSASTVVGIVTVYGTIYASYPFAVGEQNGIDALYCALAIGRRSVVVGRYLFALLMCLAFAAGALVLSGITALVQQSAFALGEAALTALLSVLIFAVILSVQLPLFFKLGYTRAKMVTYVPLMGFPLLIILVSRLLGTEALTGMATSIEAHGLLYLAVAVVAVAAIMLVSCRLSTRFYTQRDF